MDRLDIRITRDGDLDLTDNGDVQITNGMQQAIMIHLRWILAEWRLGPDFGFPYWEDVFIKNPDIERIKRDIRNEIMKVEGVRFATVDRVDYDPAARTASFTYTATTDYDTFTDEITLYAFERSVIPDDPSLVPAAPILYGDVNGDGKVDEADGALLDDYLNHRNFDIDKKAADVNRDGVIDENDLIKLRKYLDGYAVVLGEAD